MAGHGSLLVGLPPQRRSAQRFLELWATINRYAVDDVDNILPSGISLLAVKYRLQLDQSKSSCLLFSFSVHKYQLRSRTHRKADD